MSVNDGGPAFPHSLNVEQEFVGSEGMSLRDYFAGQALPGLLATSPRWAPLALSRSLYEIADAMLKTREAKP